MKQRTWRPEIENRPVLLLAIGLIVGLTAIDHPINLLFLAAPFTIAPCLRVGWLLVIGSLFGLLLHPEPVRMVESRTTVELRGTVSSAPMQNASGYGVEFHSDRQYRLTGSGPCPVEFGDEILVRGVLIPIQEVDRASAIDHGIAGRLTAASVTILEHPNLFMRLANDWRRGYRAFLRESAAPSASGMIAGMAMSLQEEISPSDREHLRATGTIHIVSGSGLHVLFLATAMMAALQLIPIARHWRLLLLALMLVAYFVASGLHPATLRAVVMVFVGWTAYLVRREYDSFSALGLAAIVDLLWRPMDVSNVGFQLSFITVATFCLFSGRRLARWAPDNVTSAVLAAVATVPILIQRQGEIGLGSIPANVLTVVVLPIVELGSMIAYVGSFLSTAFAHGLMLVVSSTAAYVSVIIEWLGSENYTIRFPAMSGYWLTIVYGAMLLTWRPRVVNAK